jgi:hypothetical protein
MRTVRKPGLVLAGLAAVSFGLAACGTTNGGSSGTGARADDPYPVTTQVTCHKVTPAPKSKTAPGVYAYVDLFNVTGQTQTVDAQIIVNGGQAKNGGQVKTVRTVPAAGSRAVGDIPPSEYPESGDRRNGHYYYHVDVPPGGVTIEVTSKMESAQCHLIKFMPADCH